MSVQNDDILERADTFIIPLPSSLFECLPNMHPRLMLVDPISFSYESNWPVELFYVRFYFIYHSPSVSYILLSSPLICIQSHWCVCMDSRVKSEFCPRIRSADDKSECVPIHSDRGRHIVDMWIFNALLYCHSIDQILCVVGTGYRVEKTACIRYNTLIIKCIFF